MKSRIEFLNTLPEDIRDKAIANSQKLNGSLHDMKMSRQFLDIESCINSMFPWHDTPEGVDYWFCVALGRNPTNG